MTYYDFLIMHQDLTGKGEDPGLSNGPAGFALSFRKEMVLLNYEAYNRKGKKYGTIPAW
jgi:hypothetical protein